MSVTKKKTCRLFLLLIFFIVPFTMVAQQFRVSGKVFDMADKPVELAEIIIFTKDTLALKNEFSDKNGQFSILLDKGAYKLEIRKLGRTLYTQNITLDDNIDVGTIKADLTFKHKEVVVVAPKNLIERKVDRLVFNVENSLFASGGDAMDALSITPGLRIQNDQIYMIGRSSMNVMVNGRFLNLAGDDLANFLKNLRSDDIKRIEVITNPPAKYDAQGNSGIVNIVTKTVRQDMFNGSVRGVISQANKSLSTGATTLNYQKKNTTLGFNASYTNGRTQPYQQYTLLYPTYLWKEDNNRTNYSSNFSARATLGYKINSNVRIGGEYFFSNTAPLIKADNNSDIYNNNGGLDSMIRNRSRIEMNKITHAVNLFTVANLDKKGRVMNVDFDYLTYGSSSKNNFFSNSYFSNGSIKPDAHFSARNASNLDIDIITTRFDFEYPTKWISLNFGTKLTFIENRSDVSFYNTTGPAPVLDPQQSNKFNYKENIQALYISGFKKLSKKLETQVGFRGENTQTEGYSQTLNRTTPNNYFRVFPTIYFNYLLSQSKTISLNYNKRINRPTYNSLNPFRFYTTSFNYAEGNPFLQPSFTNNFELTYVHKTWVTLLYANFINNGFDQVTFVEQNSISQKVIPTNFYNQANIGVYQGYSFNVKGKWENNSNISFFYSKSRSKMPAIVPGVEAWSGSINTSNIFVLDKKKKFRAELGFNYQLPSLAGSYELSAFGQLNAGLRGNFFNNKLQVTLNGVDILKTNKQTFTQTVNGIKQQNFDYADIRRIRLTVVYNFGKTFKLSKKNEVNKDEKQRLT